MRHFLAIAISLILGSAALAAQESQFDGILSRLGDERVSLRYSCTIAGPDDIGIELEGTIVAQHNSYFASGAGLAIYCDGQARWTVDEQAREVYIEQATGVQEFLTDPAGWLGTMSGLSISEVAFTTASADEEAFRFDVTGLGDDWTVVDLR